MSDNRDKTSGGIHDDPRNRITWSCGETFTDRCSKILAERPDQDVFVISRTALETLVADSERSGKANKATTELLLVAREIAADTTTMSADAAAYKNGSWDDDLASVIRRIGNGSLQTLTAQQNAEKPS